MHVCLQSYMHVILYLCIIMHVQQVAGHTCTHTYTHIYRYTCVNMHTYITGQHTWTASRSIIYVTSWKHCGFALHELTRARTAQHRRLAGIAQDTSRTVFTRKTEVASSSFISTACKLHRRSALPDQILHDHCCFSADLKYQARGRGSNTGPSTHVQYVQV